MKLLSELTLARMERLVNAALKQAYSEGPLPDCRMLLHITQLDWRIAIRIQHGYVQIQRDRGMAADLTLSGKPTALLHVAQTKQVSRDIHIAGDAHLAQTLQHWFKSTQIDWEGLLAEAIGDAPAYHFSHVFSRIKAFAQTVHRNLLENTGDYLLDETHTAIHQAEAEAFNQGVNETRYDIDRLEARINRLKQKVADHAE